MENLLEKIKAGDQVIVHGKYSAAIKTVTRTTGSLICIGFDRFKKSDGQLSPFTRALYIEAITPAKLKEFEDRRKHAEMVVKAKNIKFDKLTTEQLREILAIARGKKVKDN